MHELPANLESITREITRVESKANYKNPYTLVNLFAKKPTMTDITTMGSIPEMRKLHQLYILQFIHTLKHNSDTSGLIKKKYILQQLTNVFEQDTTGNVTKMFMIFYHGIKQALWTIFITHNAKLKKIRDIDEYVEQQIQHISSVPLALRKDAIKALDGATELILRADLRVRWKRWALLLILLTGSGAAWLYRKQISDVINENNLDPLRVVQENIDDVAKKTIRNAGQHAAETGQTVAAAVTRTVRDTLTRFGPIQYRIVDNKLVRNVGDEGYEGHETGIESGITAQVYYIYPGTSRSRTPREILLAEGKLPEEVGYRPVSDPFQTVPARDAIVFYKHDSRNPGFFYSPTDSGYADHTSKPTTLLVEFYDGTNKPKPFSEAYPEISSLYAGINETTREYVSHPTSENRDKLVRAHTTLKTAITTASAIKGVAIDIGKEIADNLQSLLEETRKSDERAQIIKLIPDQHKTTLEKVESRIPQSVLRFLRLMTAHPGEANDVLDEESS